MYKGAHVFEQILEGSVIRQLFGAISQLLPIHGMVFEVIQHGLRADRPIEPGKITGDTEVVSGTSNDGHVIYGVPRADGFSGDVIGREMLVHVLLKPDFDQTAEWKRIQQRQAQAAERCVPRKAQGGKHVAAQSKEGGPVGGIRRTPARGEKILKTVVIEIPQGFVVGVQLREATGEVGSSRSKRGMDQAFELLFVCMVR